MAYTFQRKVKTYIDETINFQNYIIISLKIPLIYFLNMAINNLRGHLYAVSDLNVIYCFVMW